MKAHIIRFVNENNEVTTAEEMKKALESHGGLRGCRVAVVEIDPSKDLHEANKIPDISLLYNFKFEDSAIGVWKAYNMGEGKPQDPTTRYRKLGCQAAVWTSSERMWRHRRKSCFTVRNFFLQ